MNIQAQANVVSRLLAVPLYLPNRKHLLGEWPVISEWVTLIRQTKIIHDPPSGSGLVPDLPKSSNEVGLFEAIQPYSTYRAIWDGSLWRNKHVMPLSFLVQYEKNRVSERDQMPSFPQKERRISRVEQDLISQWWSMSVSGFEGPLLIPHDGQGV